MLKQRQASVSKRVLLMKVTDVVADAIVAMHADAAIVLRFVAAAAKVDHVCTIRSSVENRVILPYFCHANAML